MGMETSWTLIRGAAGGKDAAREEFIARYETFVRRVLGRHWSGRAIAVEMEDTIQNIWVECFKKNGVIERADPNRSFRAFLCGVIQREEMKVRQKWARDAVRRDKATFDPEQVLADQTAITRLIDREWALQVMGEAWQAYEQWAEDKGCAALHRVEVLRLRTREGLPPRKIAERVGGDAAQASRDYAQARKEFERTLREIVARHEGDEDKNLDDAVRDLLSLLGAGGGENS